MSWGTGLNWGRGPSALAVKMFLFPSMFTLVFLWGRSRIGFVIAAVIVVILGVALAATLIAVNRQMKRYPMLPEPGMPHPEKNSNSGEP